MCTSYMVCRIYRPQIAAMAGLFRILGFIMYMRGYASGDPKKRMQGGFGTTCGVDLWLDGQYWRDQCIIFVNAGQDILPCW